MRFLNLSTAYSSTELQRVAVLAAMGLSAMSVSGQSQKVVAEALPAGACPTTVTAKYVPGAALRPVNPGSPGEARKPLQLSFGPAGETDGERITQALVTVRGISEKGGVIPAGTSAATSPWVERTLSLNVAANPAGLQSGTVWLTGFGGVGDVRIDSITYANGRVWKATVQQSCHAHTGMVLAQAK